MLDWPVSMLCSQRSKMHRHQHNTFVSMRQEMFKDIRKRVVDPWFHPERQEFNEYNISGLKFSA